MRADQAGNGAAADECSMQMQDVRALTQVLNALKSGSKQAHATVAITIAADGMRVRWEDESKTLQCSVFLPSEMFQSFVCAAGVRHTFGLNLHLLLDTLNIFASAPSETGLNLRYPGSQGELVFSMDSSRDYGPSMSTHARLGAVELPTSRDLTDFWQKPDSYFLFQGSLLKEAVEDLEWPAADVELHMADVPKRLWLTALGIPGKLQIDIPAAELLGFHLAPAPSLPGLELLQQQPGGGQPVQLHHTYKYKAMRAAFCSLAASKDSPHASTKVTIDANGMLKVTHMVGMHGAHGHTFHQDLSGNRASLTQQGAEQCAVITYVTVPMVEGDDQE